jgi:hypothetical protein
MALHDFNQKRLAQETGLNRSLLNMYLNRRLNFRSDEILRIIKALKLKDELRKLASPLSAPLEFVMR